MSLQNLLKIGRLESHEISADQVARILAAAERAVQDARQETISFESRLDASYRAIIQLALVALGANGYRPSKSQPGHHQTLIQSLVHSAELDNDQMRLLDTFRVKRNAIDYTGADVDEASVLACIEAADNLMLRIRDVLRKNNPELLR